MNNFKKKGLVFLFAIIIFGGCGGYYFLRSPAKIPSPLQLTALNGGDSLSLGSVQKVLWTYDGAETDRPLRIFLNKGTIENPQFTTFISSTTVSAGEYTIQIPFDTPEGDDYRIVIDLGKTSDGQALWFDASDADFSIGSQTSCTDSDGGENYYTKGTVNFIEPLHLIEGQDLAIQTASIALLRLDGKERRRVINGQMTDFSLSDEVYYQKDGENKSILDEMPVGVYVRNIDFRGVGNTENNADIVSVYNVSDQCIGDVLVENSCMRGINTGYYCVNGCVEGACLK